MGCGKKHKNLSSSDGGKENNIISVRRSEMLTPNKRRKAAEQLGKGKKQG